MRWFQASFLEIPCLQSRSHKHTKHAHSHTHIHIYIHANITTRVTILSESKTTARKSKRQSWNTCRFAQSLFCLANLAWAASALCFASHSSLETCPGASGQYLIPLNWVCPVELIPLPHTRHEYSFLGSLAVPGARVWARACAFLLRHSVVLDTFAGGATPGASAAVLEPEKFNCKITQ